MPEHKLLINGLEYQYKGYFNVKEILENIKNYLTAKGYSYSENDPQTTVLPQGKSYFVDMRFNKGHKNTLSTSLKIRFYFNNIIKEYVELDKVKLKLEKGIAKVIVDAWTHSYMEGYTELNPFHVLNPFKVFFKMFIKKFVFWFETTEEKIEAEVTKDAMDAFKHIKVLFKKYPTEENK